MKFMNWNAEKSIVLKQLRGRGICFEDIVFYIEKGHLMDDYEHQKRDKYPGQRTMAAGLIKNKSHPKRFARL